jgi:hypothetical protein
MSEAQYSIIRCVPDPARGELFNVGVIVWSDTNFRVAVDQVAARRAARQCPGLARDAFRSLQQYLESRLGRIATFGPDRMRDFIDNQAGLPFALGEPLNTRLDRNQNDPVADVLQKLMDRLVSPQASLDDALPAMQEIPPLEARLAPLLRNGRIQKDYEIRGGRSGLNRHIDYFANSAANVGMDLLALDRGGDETLLSKTDAEAYKIVDVLNSQKVKGYYICCSFKSDSKHEGINEDLKGILESAGGKIITNIDDAASRMEAAAAASKG